METTIGREPRIEVKDHKRKRTLTRGEAMFLGLTWAFDALDAQDALAELTLSDGRRVRRIERLPLRRKGK